MKTINIKKIFAVLAGLAFTVCSLHAQDAIPNNKAMPPLPTPANGAPPPPPQQPLQQVSAYKGTVVKFTTNDDYVYDGFYMMNNGDSLLVKFPPHLGAQITGAAKAGSTVAVNGVMHVAPMGGKAIRMFSLTADGKTITDTTAPAAMPPADTYTSGTGKITGFQTNRAGGVSGLVVDGKTILRVPPHIANQLGTVAKVNAGVAYTGMKKANRSGEVSTAAYSIVHCKTITIDGAQYLVQ